MGSLASLWPPCLSLRQSPGLCSKELQPGWFSRMHLHTPHVPPQLPGAAQQEDFCAPYGVGSYSFQLQSWIICCYPGDHTQWSYCVQPCPSEWGKNPDFGTFLIEETSNLPPYSKKFQVTNISGKNHKQTRNSNKSKTQTQQISVSYVSICSY